MAKRRLPRVDGLGPYDVSKIRSAVRMVWHRSYPRKLCVQRSLNEDGFHVCEQCKNTVPKVFIDHIERVGDVDEGFIARLFCSSEGLQALCDSCHKAKTKAERAAKKLLDKTKAT